MNAMERLAAGLHKQIETQQAEIERLTRERDEARAALKTIAEHGSTESDFPHCVAGFQNYARRALEQPVGERHLTAEEQRLMHEALRRSTKPADL